MLKKIIEMEKLVAMRIEYDPYLMQDVVFQEVKRREKGGDFGLFGEYHEHADPIYERFPIEEREREFRKLHKRFFLKLGFGEVIDKALEMFPEIRSKLEAVIVSTAITKRDEGADLGNDFKYVGIKIQVERFLDPPDLKKYLRHELMHVSDMIDDHFRYEYRERLNVSSAAEENIIRDRYSILWDIYIDSRLTREGKETVSDKDGRYREFEGLYQKIPHALQIAVFNDLWQMEKLTHNQIFEMAEDTAKLLQRLDIHPLKEGVSDSEKILLPGSLCPLCRFPTYNFVDGLGRLDENVIKLIKEEYPGWGVEEGACERCIEAYEVRERQ